MGLKIDLCICGIVVLLGHTVTFEEMQAIEFTVIVFHTHTMRIIEMLLDLQVNETRINCLFGQIKHSNFSGLVKYCVFSSCCLGKE